MTGPSARLARCWATMAVLIGAAGAQTIIQPTAPIAPNGVVVTTSEAWFSQPYGIGAPQPRGIYSVTDIAGSGSLLSATVTKAFTLPTSTYAVNQLALSPGFGGFAAGAIFATSPSSATTDAVYKNGALFMDGIPDIRPGNAGITFDAVGTFGYAMIVTTPSSVFGFNSAGTLLFAYPAPSDFFLESARVAPMTNSACPGCLYLTSESVVKPNTPSGSSPTFVVTTPGIKPANIVFITPELCTLNGTDLSYFVAAYAAGIQIDNPSSTSGALLAYSQAEVAPLNGQALIPFEGSGSAAGDAIILALNPATNVFTAFSKPIPNPPATLPAYQLEGASLVACADATGCPATPGYWAHHAFPAGMFPDREVIIAGASYKSSELIDILNSAPTGEDSALTLMRQLIAALANEAAGARNVGMAMDGVNVNLAIAEAESLLQFGLPQPGFPGANPAGVQFPINFNAPMAGFVPSSSTLGGYLTTLSNILNDYNSAAGLDCQEASGLTGTASRMPVRQGRRLLE